MDPTGDTLTAAQEYFRDLLILSLREAFGEQKAGYFGFDENYNLTLSISAANFVTGLDANQKAAFLGLNALIGHSQKVNLYYGNEIIADDGTILDINKYGGGVYLVTPYERAIIIGWNPPTINVILETAEFREVHQNRTSVLFHEIGEWLHGEDNRAGNNYRGSVIDFENTIRPTLGLPSRPYDVEHASQVPTIYR